MSAVTYPSVYRAKALMVEDGVITAYVPQVFGDTPIKITDASGPFPTEPTTGWVTFESGWSEFPVWMSGTVTPDEPIDYLTQDEADLLYQTPAQADAKYMTPAQADAQFLTPAEGDALFLTPAEGDALFLTPAEGDALFTTPAEAYYRTGVITSIAGLKSLPPTVAVDGVETLIAGKISDYALSDTVMWLPQPTPRVIRRVPLVGSSLATHPWHYVGAAGEPAFQNSWVNYGSANSPAKFWRQSDGWVHLSGTVKDGISTGTIFTLPVGFRPPIQMYFNTATSGNTSAMTVTPDGSVYGWWGTSSTWVSLDKIMFPTSMNRHQWGAAIAMANWVPITNFLNAEALCYVRDDGLVCLAGCLGNGSEGQWMLEVPAEAGVSRRQQVHISAGVAGAARLDIGGATGARHFSHNAGGGGTNSYTPLGSLNYWGVAGDDRAWIPFPFDAGWENFDLAAPSLAAYQQVEYYKDHHQVVWIRGLGKRTTGSTRLGILPPGYRPASGAQSVLTFDVMNNSNATGLLEVNAAGEVYSATCTPGGYCQTYLRFRAEQ